MAYVVGEKVTASWLEKRNFDFEVHRENSKKKAQSNEIGQSIREEKISELVFPFFKRTFEQ